MDRRSARVPRRTDDALGRAVVTGMAAGAPVAYASVAALAVGQALSENERLPAALGAALLSGEDWEILPFWLLGAVLLGAVVGAVASGAWLAVRRRARGGAAWATGAAAAVAGVLSCLPALGAVAPLGLCTALLAAAAAAVAAPRVCSRRV